MLAVGLVWRCLVTYIYSPTCGREAYCDQPPSLDSLCCEDCDKEFTSLEIFDGIFGVGWELKRV